MTTIFTDTFEGAEGGAPNWTLPAPAEMPPALPAVTLNGKRTLLVLIDDPLDAGDDPTVITPHGIFVARTTSRHR